LHFAFSVTLYNRLLFLSVLVAVNPRADKPLAIGGFLSDLLILLWQYALLRRGKLGYVRKDFYIRQCLVLEVKSGGLICRLISPLPDIYFIRPINAFDYIERKILQSADERKPKLFRRLLGHRHDIRTQVFCLGDYCQFALRCVAVRHILFPFSVYFFDPLTREIIRFAAFGGKIAPCGRF
jgi:hypothetical protein